MLLECASGAPIKWLDLWMIGLDQCRTDVTMPDAACGYHMARQPVHAGRQYASASARMLAASATLCKK